MSDKGPQSTQFMMRFPEGMRDAVRERAAINGRSMNAEIIDALQRHLEAKDTLSELCDFIDRHRSNIERLSELFPSQKPRRKTNV